MILAPRGGGANGTPRRGRTRTGALPSFVRSLHPATLQIVPENADITNERTTTMTEATMKPDPTEEELFALDISDHALEMAAKSGLEGGAYTVVFCTGLDTCPAVLAA